MALPNLVQFFTFNEWFKLFFLILYMSQSNTPSTQMATKYKKIEKKTNTISKQKNTTRSNYIFYPYTGHRWKLPEIYNRLPISIKEKFVQVSSFSHIKQSITEIHNKLQKFSWEFTPTLESWNMPDICKDSLMRARYIERSEWKVVLNIYLQIKMLVTQVSKLAKRFLIWKAKQNIINTEDPVTLEKPKKPIFVTDIAQKCTFLYEASTLRRAMSDKLITSDYMFPKPSFPVNILSNKEFSLGQIKYVYDQLKQHGEISWSLERFRASHFNLNRFKIRNKQALKLEAISFHFLKQQDSSKETVLDFFDLRAFMNHLDTSYLEWFTLNYMKEPYVSYTKKWIELARQYYDATELHEIIRIESIFLKTNLLLKELDNLIVR